LVQHQNRHLVLKKKNRYIVIHTIATTATL
jgi:hypothetical protein